MTVVEHSHDIDENGACQCGLFCDAAITYSDGTTEFIEKLDTNTMLAQNSEIKLLRDVTVTDARRFQNISVLDLNGHKLTGDRFVIANDLTVKNSSTDFGIIDGELGNTTNPNDGAASTTITVDGENIKINSLGIGNRCSASLKGGIFGRINCFNLSPNKAHTILANGYAFKKYNAETGEITDEFETAAYTEYIIENVASFLTSTPTPLNQKVSAPAVIPALTKQ